MATRAVAPRNQSPVERLKSALNAEEVQQQFKNSLKENAGAFIASVLDLYVSDNYLQECDPNKVIMECLKAATLKLPINKQLGFAYVVPYKIKGEAIPQFQIGYRGYIQLAMRTGQYRYLNAGAVYEGIEVKENLLTGETTFEGTKTSDEIQGYFAYMELLNGFSKTIYMTKDEVMNHAKKYSRSFNSSGSAWQTHFDQMAQKTVIRALLSKYGILTTEMAYALTSDQADIEDSVASEIAFEANSEVIDVTPEDAQLVEEAAGGPGF